MTADPATFRALHTGAVALALPGITTGTQRLVEVGTLNIISGGLSAQDPLVASGGQVASLPAGEYPVIASVTDCSPAQDGSDERVAYFSVVVANGTAAQLSRVGGQLATISCVSGLVAFADAAARAAFDADLNDGAIGVETGEWVTQPLAGHPAVNLLLPTSDHVKIAVAASGAGPGDYPLYATADSAGALLGLHVDFAVVSSLG